MSNAHNILIHCLHRIHMPVIGFPNWLAGDKLSKIEEINTF